MKLKLKNSNIQKTIFGKILLEKEKKLPNIFFYDYEGTLLYEYTAAQFLALSALPALPDRTNENLTCDGWNWTLLEIKNQINNVGGDVNVGAIYHTTDGKTHITCRPTSSRPWAIICLTPTVANAVTIDWGDGSTDIWTSTSQASKSHTYTGVTDSSVYDITVSCSSGTYSFSTYIAGTAENNKNYIYTDIRLSNKVTSLSTNCFNGCYYLQSITIPDGVTWSSKKFLNCYHLKSINIPGGVTNLGASCFQNCYSLQSITIPNGITNLGNYCFYSCYSLQSITLPNGITSLGNYCFDSCHQLHQSIVIPNGVTILNEYCFDLCSLQSITIPSGVTDIKSNCLYSSYNLNKIYIKSTTPPTIISNSLPDNNNLVIYVPTGTLATYQSADTWSNYASKMVEYDY